MTHFGAPEVRFDALDGILLLHQLNKLHRVTLGALDRFPQSEIENFDLINAIMDEVETDDEGRHDFYRERFREMISLERLELFSSFLLAYAVFEFTCTMMCETVLKTRKSPLLVKDFHDKGLRRIETIFSKIGGASQCFEIDEWRRCKELNSLRDKIAHTGGLVGVGEDDANRLAKLDSVSLVKFGTNEHFLQIALDPLFVDDARSVFEAFLMASQSELEEKLHAAP